MTRDLACPPSRAWEAIASAEQMSQWYPMRVHHSGLEPDAALTFTDDDGTTLTGRVIGVAPGRSLAFIEEEADTLELAVEDGPTGTTFTLVHGFSDGDLPGYAAGWHTCLAFLAALVTGGPQPASTQPTEATIIRYRQQFDD